MKMEIERSLDLPLPAPKAWNLLENIETVAACMPGAKITEKVDESHYKGVVGVRLGPANVSFKGEIHILAMDATARQIRLAGKGADGTSSAATLELSAVLKEIGPESSQVSGKSEVTVNGKVASFGSRLMNTVADQLVNQFYANLLKQAEEMKAAASSAESAAVPAAAAAPAQDHLDGLALLWAIIRDFFRGLLFRRRAT